MPSLQPIAAVAEARQCPSLSAPARGTAQAAGQDGLPPQDALMATELAIQLDELIKWVRAQADVDPKAVPSR